MLYSAIEPFACGMLPLDDCHQMYWEQCGLSSGVAVLYLHGGPGEGCMEICRQLFDPNFYRAVLFDQRGCGRSIPRGELRENTTALLIQDIERLRLFLGIERWLLVGGSWGSTLALVYAQAYPERVSGLLLRGIFLGRSSEIDWFLYGMRQFFPEAWQRFANAVPKAERTDLLQAYYRRLTSADKVLALTASRSWALYEASCAYLTVNADLLGQVCNEYVAFPLARLEAHYFKNQLFLQANQVLRDLPRIVHLPVSIVQGRYDVICPPASAFELAQAWPKARLCLVESAGHSAWDASTLSVLLDELERFKQLFQ